MEVHSPAGRHGGDVAEGEEDGQGDLEVEKVRLPRECPALETTDPGVGQEEDPPTMTGANT